MAFKILPQETVSVISEEVSIRMKTEVIACGETLDITDMNALYPQLLTALLEQKQLVFDCSEVERIDASALQMLYAFSKASSLHGYKASWDNPSQSFINSAQLLGVATEMGISVSKGTEVQA
ncbi:MAG: anti-anti-sigma regulatory factor [Methylophagaceae bacterium]|jgi:anti-anti-sigma regulatory factor